MQSRVNPSLPPPERHFPIENGRYEVKPGLRRVVGNIFQIDREFDKFRKSKLVARAERLSKYYATVDLKPEIERAVNHFILHRLVAEHPAAFSFNGNTLRSTLTGDVLHFSSEFDYIRVRIGCTGIAGSGRPGHHQHGRRSTLAERRASVLSESLGGGGKDRQIVRGRS
jgi:hypothetical protein